MKLKALFILIVLLMFLFPGCKREYHPTLNPKWAEITLTAKGVGAPPNTAENPAQAQLLACKAAEIDAYRNLSEKLYGVYVESNTTVRDFITRSDEIRTNTEGFIRKARIISQRENPDGSCEVMIELYLGKKFAETILR